MGLTRLKNSVSFLTGFFFTHDLELSLSQKKLEESLWKKPVEELFQPF